MKTSLDISCVKQTIHMKYQDLFSLKKKKKKKKKEKIECRLLQILLGALRVKIVLFDFWFYGPVNTGSCRAHSVYLTTLFSGQA